MIFRALLLINVLSSTSCIMSWDHEHEYTHTAFDRDDADKIVIGSTSSEWIVDTFGEPDSRLTRDDGGELWKYENRGNRDVRFFMFPIIDVDVKTDQRETLSISIQDEVVIDYWIINDER